jgi:predicted nucleotidyltransferase
MNTYNLSSDKIPQHIINIIKSLKEILDKQAYDFILIGATARDIIIDGIYDLGISRLTADVDFAVFVPEWDNYTSMMNKLINSGRFSPTKATHKLMYDNAYEIDIVPFGDIQDKEGQYTWPPDNIKTMNVAGFAEISDAAINIISSNINFKIASVPGICIMKLLAWKDRGLKDNRDGKDLGFILANYIEMKYEDLYAAHEDLMISPDFDRVVTTARIMGRDIGDLLKSNNVALRQVYEILDAATEDEEYSRLALSMKDGGSISYKTAYDAVIALMKGISDKNSDK